MSRRQLALGGVLAGWRCYRSVSVENDQSSIQPVDVVPEAGLDAVVTLLQRSIYGSSVTSEWNGDMLTDAFISRQSIMNGRHSSPEDAALPPINPII